MISEELLQILVCPVCKGDLEYDRQGARLNCPKCCLSYLIKDDIPIMLPEEAEPLPGGQRPGKPA